MTQTTPAKTVKYRWVCHSCTSVNEAGIAACVSCGLDAFASAKEFMPKVEKTTIQRGPAESVIMDIPMLFFPEIVPAVLIVICSPIWFIALLFHGHFVAALILLLGVGGFTVGFILALREKSAWLAYCSMAGVLMSAYFAGTLS